MIIEHYSPNKPSNELQALTLQRMQARDDANKALLKLRNNARMMISPQASRFGIVTTLISNVPIILAGISMGKKIIKAIKE
ncbi:MAG: hypothetical protein HUK00_02255 [Bacteroidaceae bacterium]|nr:hypothetical protein [Bacteroidaceae bacterium]